MPGFPPPNFFIEYFSLQTSAKIIHIVGHILKKTQKDHKELQFRS
jgi:hypothetical protein